MIRTFSQNHHVVEFGKYEYEYPNIMSASRSVVYKRAVHNNEHHGGAAHSYWTIYYAVLDTYIYSEQHIQVYRISSVNHCVVTKFIIFLRPD